MDMFDKRNLYPFSFGDAWPPEPVPPLHDAVSGITFHVNSDGRHIEAINAAGRKLWVRNPFVDQDLCPYRSAHPFIRKMNHALEEMSGAPNINSDADANALVRKALAYPVKNLMKRRMIKEGPRNDDRFINIAFNSSQFGFVNIRNGDFYYLGQN